VLWQVICLLLGVGQGRADFQPLRGGKSGSTVLDGIVADFTPRTIAGGGGSPDPPNIFLLQAMGEWGFADFLCSPVFCQNFSQEIATGDGSSSVKRFKA
jgi:hypothetical protein